MMTLLSSRSMHKTNWPFLLHNNSWFGSEGPALRYRGSQLTITNNAFINNDWSARQYDTKGPDSPARGSSTSIQIESNWKFCYKEQ